MAAQQNLYVPDFEEDPIMTDDDHDTILTIDNDLPWQPYHPEHNFSYVHSVVFHYITQWATLKTSKSHSFYPKLQRFKYAGLKHIMTWTEVQKVLNVQSLQQYVHFMQLCPAVDDNLRLAVDNDYNTIRFTWKMILAHDEVLDIVTNAQASYQGLQHLSFNFRNTFEQMTNQMQTISTKLVFQQDSIAKETKKGLQAITTLTETSIKTIQETTDAGMTLINSKWFQFSGGEFNSFKTKIHDTMKGFENQLATTKTDFTEWLNNTTKELEALLATKNATQSTSSISQI
jgi:paraquat-inducible protein B